MNIQSTTFGSITIGDTTYDHDVVIRLDGQIIKRKKKLSKQQYGTSHILSVDEMRFVYENGCDSLIIGCGQYGRVKLSDEAAHFLDSQNCTVISYPTPQAAEFYNTQTEHKNCIALFHVTC
ncbi:MAG: hypothetical protein HQL69_04700 [Magnetococcales bacterium]|nr:hypothetical protein [Magnetococcales bacterium]